MKIILFSDVHSNLPALEAFFEEVEKQNPDAVYCLGDLVGYNMWPNEAINEIRSRRIPTISGNYDYGIGRSSNECGCAYKSEEEKSNGAISIKVTNALIGKEEREYLKDLPAHIRLEFQTNLEGKINLLLVHGSPRKNNEYLFEDRPEKSLLRIFNEAGADILCFGHTHKPYHRILECEGVPTIFRHAINTGSIGKPKDGDSTGVYVILNISNSSSLTVKDSIKVEFKRFSYNVERAAKAIEDSELPNAYALALRNGK